MPEVEIKDIKGHTVEKVKLSEELFGVKGYDSLLHEAKVNYLANQRQGTHATKTKGLVSGGGKKPYKQKKTGRARAGSIRSPLWRGGGTVFGPQPRDYSFSIPRKARRLALTAALSRKAEDGEVLVVDNIKFDKPKTKDMVAIIKNMGVKNETVLLVLPEKDDKLLLSARNIPAMGVAVAKDLNAYDVISYGKVLMTRDALRALELRTGAAEA